MQEEQQTENASFRAVAILSHFASTACAGAADQRPCKALVAMVFFLELLTSVVHGCVRGTDLTKQLSEP